MVRKISMWVAALEAQVVPIATGGSQPCLTPDRLPDKAKEPMAGVTVGTVSERYSEQWPINAESIANANLVRVRSGDLLQSTVNQFIIQREAGQQLQKVNNLEGGNVSME